MAPAATPLEEPARGRQGLARALAWPLAALLVWAAGWGVWALLRSQGAAPWAAFVAATVPGLVAAGWPGPAWRRAILALGFPLSALLAALASQAPAWSWLAPLVVLLAVYPLRGWRDAPLFPTPARALEALPAVAPLQAQARVLDAGCGIGDGLRALRRAYPAAELEGIELSRALAAAARLRCRWARIEQADYWRQDWSGYDLVYFFQRPESMPEAIAKARREMREGAFFVSLEFEAPGAAPHAVCDTGGVRRLWVYRVPAHDRRRGLRAGRDARNKGSSRPPDGR